MENTCPILGLDHLEFYVGNAKQAAFFYETQFGLRPIAFRGLETGYRKAASYLLSQGNIHFVLSSALGADHPMGEAVARHGDGVGAIAFSVADVRHVYQTAVQKGATAVIPPTDIEDCDGRLRFAAIKGYGDILFKFVERQGYDGLFAPGFMPCQNTHQEVSATGLTDIDHVVGNVEVGAMDHWVNFFIEALGFNLLVQFD
ncbi:MAG: VOC family protein, partial [Cyanobacteria bacterium P01_D01_bin.44]